MNKTSVIAIFDIGKTNKKLFLFDDTYKIVFEKSKTFSEIADEEGDPCEDLQKLSGWVMEAFQELLRKDDFKIVAINFSTYGASLVYVDDHGKPLTPLYNYLKIYPQKLSKEIYDQYGGEVEFALATASPLLGSLNSGMQLYRLKQKNNTIFQSVKYALHLPQYFSFLFSQQVFSDITSIGCHTALWDFKKNTYHSWVAHQRLEEKLAPIHPADKAVDSPLYKSVKVGIGLHDSSAALIPYLANFEEPFVLLSTGTWNIALNPFNQSFLTANELKNDCLCYYSYQGKPVKASRFFAGFEHEQQVKRISEHFNTPVADFTQINFNASIFHQLQEKDFITVFSNQLNDTTLKQSGFAHRDLSVFNSAIEGYYQLMLDIVNQQCASIQLVLNQTSVKRIYVDGGFSKNSVFMSLLSAALPEVKIYSATMAQATALGAALAIHHAWNSNSIPTDLIELKEYFKTPDEQFK